jgi:hypothetical protein
MEEDKQLKIAIMFCGPKTWKKIATFIPSQNEVQCREMYPCIIFWLYLTSRRHSEMLARTNIWSILGYALQDYC